MTWHAIHRNPYLKSRSRSSSRKSKCPGFPGKHICNKACSHARMPRPPPVWKTSAYLPLLPNSYNVHGTRKRYPFPPHARLKYKRHHHPTPTYRYQSHLPVKPPSVSLSPLSERHSTRYGPKPHRHTQYFLSERSVQGFRLPTDPRNTSMLWIPNGRIRHCFRRKIPHRHQFHSHASSWFYANKAYPRHGCSHNNSRCVANHNDLSRAHRIPSPEKCHRN